MGHRWLSEAGPGSRLPDVARLAFAERLPPVVYFFPLAACHAEADVEYVHQLRVATRRAGTALRLFHDLVPSELARRVRRRLKQIRRAAGPARELDVMLARLSPLAAEGRLSRDEEAGLRQVWTGRRAAAQQVLAARHARLLERRYFVPLYLISGHLRWPGGGKSPRWGDVACDLLRGHVRRVVQRSRRLDSVERLHGFRIACKQLRYAIELSSPALAEKLLNRLYPAARDLQEHLGRLNDHVSALELLRPLDDAPPCEVSPAVLSRLRTAEEEAAARLTVEFRAWWASDEGRSVRRALTDVMAK